MTLDSRRPVRRAALGVRPGTKWNYSNSGYILLGAILEKASGQSWEAYLREHIFKPAGMSHSSASAFNGQLPGEALGYAEGDSGYEVATYLSMSWPYAAGTMRSTVGDLWAWNRSVFAGKLPPRSWVERKRTPNTCSPTVRLRTTATAGP
ncbi:MAG: beta-lactamase family protein [Flavobacteriales bacterium]|nr:beta-lactamase family protein [Flavobacteriales bacterium]